MKTVKPTTMAIYSQYSRCSVSILVVTVHLLIQFAARVNEHSEPEGWKLATVQGRDLKAKAKKNVKAAGHGHGDKVAI